MARLLVVEGAQGVGKTTFTSYLREQIPGSNLLRLSGSPIISEDGRSIMLSYYKAWVDFFYALRDENILFILDRFLFSELVYTRLGYKEYDFEREFSYLFAKLLTSVDHLTYVNLVLSEQGFLDRLQGRGSSKPVYGDVYYEGKKSMAQQRCYANVLTYLETFEDYRKKVSRITLSSDSPVSVLAQKLRWFSEGGDYNLYEDLSHVQGEQLLSLHGQ